MITQEQERRQFIASWRNKAPECRPQIVEEVASWHRESNRKIAKGIDYYLYDVDGDGDFISPADGQKITNGINQESGLGQIETEVVRVLQEQNKLGEEVFVWISPQYPDTYFDLKITITNQIIEKGRKRFENRAILFDCGEQQSLELAQKLAAISKNRPLLSSLEEIRRTLLVLDPNLDWVKVLAEITGDEELGEIIRAGKDKKAKLEALEKADQFYNDLLGGSTVELKIENVDFSKAYGFGESLSSCPPVANQRTIENGWHCGACQKCGKYAWVGQCSWCEDCEDEDNNRNFWLKFATISFI